MSTREPHPPEATGAPAERHGRGNAAEGPGRFAPFLPAALALVLAALVAAASRGTPVWTALLDGHASRAAALNSAASAVSLALVVITAGVLLGHFALLRRGGPSLPLRRKARRLLPVTLIAMAFVALVTVAFQQREPAEPPRPGALQLEWFSGLGLANAPQEEAAVPAGMEELDSVPPAPAAAEDSGLSLLLLLLFLAAAAGIAVAVARRWSGGRRPVPMQVMAPPAEVETTSSPALREALLSTIEQMLQNPDPRTAIIGAYALLLERVSAVDVPRHAHEAPLEHLRRVLRQLGNPPAPLEQLVGLFEIARFSPHTPTQEHRTRALQALRAAVAYLEARDPTRAGTHAGVGGRR